MFKVHNWKLLISVIAVLIFIATYFFSDRLAEQLSVRERKKVEAWAAAQQLIASSGPDQNLALASVIVAEQQDIPVIETDERDSIMSYVNLDSVKVARNPAYLAEKLRGYQEKGSFITTYLEPEGKRFNRYYYGESNLLTTIRYFPTLQLLIVLLFSGIMLFSIVNEYRSAQNRLWAGLAKETAHQLGTPISALAGWTEILRHGKDLHGILPEMEKDIERLKLISDRFSMIGGTPKKEVVELCSLLDRVVDYIRKRASEKIQIQLHLPQVHNITVQVSPPLIEWVIENLLKNALDATEGRGTVVVELTDQQRQVCIDITDTGKGIRESDQSYIFSPGYSTKKRGWGVGLTLSKRIVEEYHGGSLFLKESSEGRGSTFRLILKK